MIISMTLSTMTQPNNTEHKPLWQHNAKCLLLRFSYGGVTIKSVMLSVIVLGVVMLSVTIKSVMLSVIVLGAECRNAMCNATIKTVPLCGMSFCLMS
jgi:hypothetical protein